MFGNSTNHGGVYDSESPYDDWSSTLGCIVNKAATTWRAACNNQPKYSKMCYGVGMRSRSGTHTTKKVSATAVFGFIVFSSWRSLTTKHASDQWTRPTRSSYWSKRYRRRPLKSPHTARDVRDRGCRGSEFIDRTANLDWITQTIDDRALRPRPLRLRSHSLTLPSGAL